MNSEIQHKSAIVTPLFRKAVRVKLTGEKEPVEGLLLGFANESHDAVMLFIGTRELNCDHSDPKEQYRPEYRIIELSDIESIEPGDTVPGLLDSA